MLTALKENTGVAAVGCAAIACGYGAYKLNHHFEQKKLYTALDSYQEERQLQFQAVRDRLNSKSQSEKDRLNEIGRMSFKDLRLSLQIKSVTAIEALEAYQRKALESHAATNCLCQFVPTAEKRARDLDMIHDQKISQMPLFGLPFSVKASINVADCLSTRGYVREVINRKTAEENALIVQKLIELGAIPFVKTNVPQTLLSFGCSNPIYGTTTNPHSSERTCGGSSGGEAALIGSGGLFFGVGSDVGGSIRIPSSFCGIAGLKPTSQRVPQEGSLVSMPGRPFLVSSLGLMASDATVLYEVYSCLLQSDMCEDDCYVMPRRMPRFNATSGNPVVIGYYVHDGWFEPAGCYVRAVNEAAAVLRSFGHKLVPWKPPRMLQVFELMMAAAFMDGGDYMLNELRGDIAEPSHAGFYNKLRLPIWLRRASALFMDPRPQMVARCAASNISELREIYAKIQEYRREVQDDWRNAGLHAVLCPPIAVPALPPSAPTELVAACSYTALFNLLDYPAGVLPWTRVSAEDEKAMLDYPLVDRADKFSTLVRDYGTKGTVGLPVGIQIAALPFNEELCLSLLELLEERHKEQRQWIQWMEEDYERELTKQEKEQALQHWNGRTRTSDDD